MNLKQILLTLLLLCVNCNGASKSLTSPASLSQIAFQVAADVKTRHEADLKAKAIEAASVAQAYEVQAVNAGAAAGAGALGCQAVKKDWLGVIHNPSHNISEVRELKSGNLVVSYSYSKTIDILEVQNNYEPLHPLEHESIVFYSIIELEDGKLASCTQDRTIYVWDLNKSKGNDPKKDERCVAKLVHEKDYKEDANIRLSVIQLADGRLVSYYNNEVVRNFVVIRVWDLSKQEDQRCVTELKGHESSVRLVIQLKDGRLASCSYDGTIRIWDLRRPKGQECIAVLHNEQPTINSMVEIDNDKLVVLPDCSKMYVWDLNNASQISILVDSKEYVREATKLKDGRVASLCYNGLIRLWDLSKPEGQQCVDTIIGSTEINKYRYGCNHLLIQLKDGRLAAGSKFGIIRILATNAEGKYEIVKIIDPGFLPSGITQLNDGRIIIFCDKLMFIYYEV